ncbi:hypothetical protein N0V84_003840 [Fusarium piperis]|uniref:Uncharacterized protein n=1 Tax=Fusarium piperis TaxID=1435070 RepID=A0A9W9BR18_9HYPO|nr:hypothetical protein N0V84_003840 [Fusarium piperis]
MLYRDYEEPLLPLITFLTGADNPLLPIQPCSLITALNLELNQVGYEVAAWQGSSLPGPENGLQDRISRCQRRFRTIQLRFVTIFRNTNLLVKAKTAFALARAINEVTLDHQVIGLIKAFWVLHEGWNRHTLDELWVIRRQLRAIMNEIPSIFTEVDQGLRPHIDDPIRTWTRDAIDAIEFSREHVLPLIEWVVSLVERAITKLSSLDSRIALQVQFWRNMIVAQGITREVTCHREVDGERLYLGLVVACEEVTTHWLLDNRTVEELVNVGKRGAEMGKAITWHKDERRPYHEVRPPRPSERDKQRRN